MKFKDTASIKRFDKEYLLEQASDWLVGCLADFQQGLEYTIKYVTSLKNLVEIRDVVIDLEAGITQETAKADSQQCGWLHVCQVLFNKELLIWSLLVSPFYHAQTKLIIESALQTTHETLINSLRECISDNLFLSTDPKTALPDMDINSYIWSIESSDLTSSISAQQIYVIPFK